MKLTKQKIFDLINEELSKQPILEVLNSEPYPFKIYDGPNYLDNNSRMSVEYTFVSQKGEEERRFRYIVKFTLTKKD